MSKKGASEEQLLLLLCRIGRPGWQPIRPPLCIWHNLRNIYAFWLLQQTQISGGEKVSRFLQSTCTLKSQSMSQYECMKQISQWSSESELNTTDNRMQREKVILKSKDTAWKSSSFTRLNHPRGPSVGRQQQLLCRGAVFTWQDTIVGCTPIGLWNGFTDFSWRELTQWGRLCCSTVHLCFLI